MRHKYVLRLCRNFLDLNPRQVLAVPYGALILLLALELKDNSLNAATVRQNGPCHARALGGRAGLHAFAVHHCKHSPELDFGAGFPRERFHFNGLSWSDAVLFPACLDYCVHGSSSSRFSCWLNLAPKIHQPSGGKRQKLQDTTASQGQAGEPRAGQRPDNTRGCFSGAYQGFRRAVESPKLWASAAGCWLKTRTAVA